MVGARCKVSGNVPLGMRGWMTGWAGWCCCLQFYHTDGSLRSRVGDRNVIEGNFQPRGMFFSSRSDVLTSRYPLRQRLRPPSAR